MQIFYLTFSSKKRDFLYRVELLLNYWHILNIKRKPCICRKWLKYKVFLWVQGPDLNRRPPGYEPDELPNCSTLRYLKIAISTNCLYSITQKNNSVKHILTFILKNYSENLTFSKIKKRFAKSKPLSFTVLFCRRKFY